MSTKIRINNNSDADISKELEKYLLTCELEGQSDSTLRDKKYKLNAFVTHCKGHIDTSSIQGYILYLKEKGLRNTSINAHLRYINSFCKYLGLNIATKYLKTETVIKDTYTEKELKILLKKPNKIVNFTTYRNWVLVNLLFSTGIRIGSTPYIKYEDVDMQNRTIIIRKSKSNKQYYVYISNVMYKILIDYLPIIKEYGYLFPNEFGKQCSVVALQLCIRRYNKALGVNLLSVHAFRRTFAQMNIKNGCDIATLQRLMGHKSINSTKKYLDFADSDIQDSFNRYNPIDNLMQKNSKVKL